MDLASEIRPEPETKRSSRKTPPIDWSFVWPWVLGFGLTAYLGLSGGGFDVLVSGQVGVAIWWILLLAVAVGALPQRRPSTPVLCVLGLFAALVLWTALSLRWTESTEKTALDLARMATLLGIFALALFSGGKRSYTHLVNAVAAGIVLIAIVALLSRLHPTWFPEASETGQFLEIARERLSFPLDYWNGLAALIAIGLPLVFQIANGAKSVITRGLAAAALPAMMLALFFTLSRNGIAGALIATVVFVALTHNRLPQLVTILLTAIGGGILIAIGARQDELVHGLANSAAESQGSKVFWIAIVVCVLIGLAQAGLALAGSRAERPAWTRVSRRQSQIALGVAVAAIVVGLLAINAPGRLSDAWDHFRSPSGASERGTSRLTSVGGENRYQLWSSSVRQFDDEPLTGTGSGTFQLWWTRDGDVDEPILDTHNLYLQTLGEIGLIGTLFLVAFIVASLLLGVARVLGAVSAMRPQLAAALAGSTVLWTTSIFDWMWKIPVIPAATLMLIAAVIMSDGRVANGRAAFSPPLRVGVAIVSVLALVAIAIPLAGTTLIRESQSEAREGDLSGALSKAESAQNVQPGAATPRIQEALLLEAEGEFGPAEAAAVAATEREPTNWRTWLVLSRIQAENQQPDAALASFRQARSLDPLSPIFAGP